MDNAKTARRFIPARMLLAWLALLTLLVASWGALAQGSSASSNANSVNRADNGHNKIAQDLDRVLNGQGSGHEKWVKQTPSGKQLSVIVLANGKNDPDLKELRKAIVAVGGSVKRKFTSITGVAATMPAGRVNEISKRSDVWRVTPNRTVVGAGSMLEMVTGADGVRGLGAAGATLDGAGVGNAFPASGIMSSHRPMIGAGGGSRGPGSVDFTSAFATLHPPGR